MNVEKESASSVRVLRLEESEEAMKKTSRRRKSPEHLRPEYDFDYKHARPNRFASRLQGKIAVVLEADVAEVFQSSESVNRLLRSVISAVPKRQNRAVSRKRQRKAV